MKFLFLCCSLILSSYSFADSTTCFERIYTKNHLRNNPQQMVRGISLTVVDVEGVIEVHSSVNVVGSKTTYHLSAGCENIGKTIHCQSENGGDSLKLIPKNSSFRMEIVGTTSFYEVESENSVTLDRNSDDKIFLMNKIPCN